jgi:hypothetical protein
LQGAVQAAKQWRTHMVFQNLDLTADSGLRHI